MAQIYSWNFIAVSNLDGEIDYTVPAGYTLVLRSVDAVWYLGFTEASLTVKGNADQAIWVASFSPSESGQLSNLWQGWRGRHVMTEGEVLHVLTTSALDVSCDGYLLSN